MHATNFVRKYCFFPIFLNSKYTAKSVKFDIMKTIQGTLNKESNLVFDKILNSLKLEEDIKLSKFSVIL